MYLVTGGAGFIGSHIATALVERGDRVRILDNLSTGSRSNLAHLDDVDFIHGDVCDSRALERALEGVTVVFHQAALASVPRSVERPLDTHEACATGALRLLDAARRVGVQRVVYAGSSSVYGNQATHAKRETDVPRPLSPYAAAKLAGEQYCHAFYATYALEIVVIRYFNVFGPRQDPASQYSAVIPKFVSSMLAGRRPTVFGDGRQSRDFTYVENVVDGNLRAADNPNAAGQVFNVACGKQFSLLQLIDGINEVLNTNLKPSFKPARPGDVLNSVADISLAQEILGYEPRVGFEEGLKRSVEYYRRLVI